MKCHTTLVYFFCLGLGLAKIPSELAIIPSEETDNDTEFEILMEELREKYKHVGIPSHKNWIKEGIVTWPKNQGPGHCRACATFAATGAIESCFIKVKYNRVMMSDY